MIYITAIRKVAALVRVCFILIRFHDLYAFSVGSVNEDKTQI